MIVMKFGGTSIQDRDAIERAGNIIASRIHETPVVVFSAMGKTTRHLLNVLQKCHHKLDYSHHLSEIFDYHNQLIHSILTGRFQKAVGSHLAAFQKEMESLLQAVDSEKPYPLDIQDQVLSFGELMSTRIMCQYLLQNGLPAIWMDARSLIRTNDWFTCAKPDMAATHRQINDSIQPILNQAKLPVTQGFIASDTAGRTTTLGFEGSDYSASILGHALNARRLEIWKDVPGLMSVDPRLLDESCIVPTLSFEEAAELTASGAKVLHPDTIAPAREKGIPVHVLNARDPASAGTIISHTPDDADTAVKSIAVSQTVVVLDITPQTHAIPKIDRLLTEAHIGFHWIHSSPKRALLALTTDEKLSYCLELLHRQCRINVESRKAAISLVGKELKYKNAFASEIQALLRAEGIAADVTLSESPIRVTLIIDRSEMTHALNRLHRFLFI